MIDAPPDRRTILGPMSSADAIVRQEPIGVLASLGGILVRGNVDLGVDRTAAEAAVREGVAAECVLCGMRLSGPEILDLAGPAGAPGDSPKLARLRLGYCARNGCDSHYYRITFLPRPGIAWARLLPEGELRPADPEPEMDEAQLERQALHRIALRRMLRRGALGGLAIAFLLLARHWYQGGTIPVIREGEKFRVDVIPDPPNPHRP